LGVDKKDLILILGEIKFSRLRILYTDHGRMPKSSIYWQDIFPFLKGELFSDNLILIAKKDA
jgi:hypothetical protein